LYQIYANENRTLVHLSSLPNNLVNATIAIEDKDFYKNPGFDINGIIRAAVADFSGKPIQGGSTITQQLIKSTLLTPEISIERKIKEIVLALWAEKIYTKNQILEMYFNQVPYGGTAWGVEAASETYFGKNVKNLDLAQSAFLAGMPQAPSDYSPYGQNPNLWKKRQKEVLNKMVSLKYITNDQAIGATNESLNFETPQTPIYAPHFVMYVKDLLVKKYGLGLVERGGLNVITSLDLNTQNIVQDIVRQEVDNDSYLNLTNGAALITNPKNGDILAMVGSRDYNDPNDGNVNLTTSLRQPGSSIKTVTYAAALSNGFTAATILDDSPITYSYTGGPSYSPVNYDGAFHGKVPLRIAFANSFNVPAVKTLAKIGIPTMVSMAKKMGITTWGTPDNYGLSLTLGAAEVKMTDMATVYGTVANLGQRVDVNPILKITDYANNILYQKDGVDGENVLDPGVTFIISNILADNNARSLEFGTNSPLNIPGHIVSVKTGTTDNKRDNWTIGFTPYHLVAVWVGNNDNSPMSPTLASGITGAAPIWNKIMSSLLANVNDVGQSMPDDITQKKCGGKIEYFIKGTENLVNCNFIATPSGTLSQ
jgi:1A family penicillin-binding protein